MRGIVAALVTGRRGGTRRAASASRMTAFEENVWRRNRSFTLFGLNGRTSPIGYCVRARNSMPLVEGRVSERSGGRPARGRPPGRYALWSGVMPTRAPHVLVFDSGLGRPHRLHGGLGRAAWRALRLRSRRCRLSLRAARRGAPDRTRRCRHGPPDRRASPGPRRHRLQHGLDPRPASAARTLSHALRRDRAGHQARCRNDAHRTRCGPRHARHGRSATIRAP